MYIIKIKQQKCSYRERSRDWPDDARQPAEMQWCQIQQARSLIDERKDDGIQGLFSL